MTLLYRSENIAFQYDHHDGDTCAVKNVGQSHPHKIVAVNAQTDKQTNILDENHRFDQVILTFSDYIC